MNFTKTLKTIGKLLSPLKKSIIHRFQLHNKRWNHDDGNGIDRSVGYNRALILLK